MGRSSGADKAKGRKALRKAGTGERAYSYSTPGKQGEASMWAARYKADRAAPSAVAHLGGCGGNDLRLRACAAVGMGLGLARGTGSGARCQTNRPCRGALAAARTQCSIPAKRAAPVVCMQPPIDACPPLVQD
jgi:hypothetical protein